MLIAMAVHSTQENGRLDYTLRTLFSLENTVDFDKHRLVIVDNGSDEETQKALDEWGQMHPCELIRFDENRGTAVAINAAWKMRAPWEHAVKMDDDVVIHEYGWTDLMEKVFEKDSSIGICGLKRKDLEEWPLNQHEWFKSEFIALPHTRGVSRDGHLPGVQ
jgi:glycosyltransferase involved in cell wall biosynthesis